MSDDRYSQQGGFDDDATRPISADNPGTRPQQSWPSAAQRREHPRSVPFNGPGQAGYQLPDRSGAAGAFAAALVATLVGVAVSVGASFAASQLGGVGAQPRRHLYDLGLAVWPSSRKLVAAADPTRTPIAFDTTTFIASFTVAALVLVVLLWAAVGSVPGGRGAFSVFLAGWGGTLVAGVAASLVGYVIAADRVDIWRMLDFGFGTGGAWAIHVGPLVGLVAAIGHSLRRKTA